MIYLYTIIGIIFLTYFIYIINKLIFNYERNLLFRRFPEIWSVYIFSKENAFATLYKQQISVLYTSRATAMDKKETLSKLEKVFIQRVIEMCGKNILNDLSKMFGGTDPIILDLSEYYSAQILDLEAGTFEQETAEFTNLFKNGQSSNKKITKKTKLNIF